MEISLSSVSSLRLLIKTLLLVLGISFPASASTFSRVPLFEEVNQYETTITTNGDSTDIYYPETTEIDNFPVALFLQGALVDKADYSNFATQVASYGFVVIVPNHFQSFPEFNVSGLIPEVSQIDDVLAYVEAENSNSTSPLAGIVDTDNLALLGHSQGGAVGLSAIGDYCIFVLCSDNEFTLPEEVFSGVFYGAFLPDGLDGEFLPIDNQGIPVGLISGSKDGVSTPEEIIASYAQIQDPPKALITVEGANHYGITNEDSLRDPLRPTLEQNIANETIAFWTSLFLHSSLSANFSSDTDLLDTADSFDNNVTVLAQSKSVREPFSTITILTFGLVFLWLRRSISN